MKKKEWLEWKSADHHHDFFIKLQEPFSEKLVKMENLVTLSEENFLESFDQIHTKSLFFSLQFRRLCSILLINQLTNKWTRV